MTTTAPSRTETNQPAPHRIYGIRSVRGDMTSHNGFKWPESGEVTAPDWNDRAECGGGLHFLRQGDNLPGTWYAECDGGKILVISTDCAVVNIGGKAKCERCRVEYCGDMIGACAFLASLEIGSGWYRGTATAGDGGTATAGDDGTATAGDGGTATAGDGGTATAGDGGTVLIKWHDGNRLRIKAGYIGENGMKPNVPYRVDNDGNFVEVAK